MYQLETALEQNGFRKTETTHPLPPHERASAMWQIRIRDNSGTTLRIFTHGPIIQSDYGRTHGKAEEYFP